MISFDGTLEIRLRNGRSSDMAEVLRAVGCAFCVAGCAIGWSPPSSAVERHLRC